MEKAGTHVSNLDWRRPNVWSTSEIQIQTVSQSVKETGLFFRRFFLEVAIPRCRGKSSHALPASFMLRNKFTNTLAIMLTFYLFHLLTPHHNSKILLKFPTSNSLQLRGLSVDGLKADLQQRLRETVHNTATTTHTTKTAREGTMNTNDNTKNADNAALPTEVPTHAEKTTNTDEIDGNSGNAMMQESPGLSSRRMRDVRGRRH